MRFELMRYSTFSICISIKKFILINFVYEDMLSHQSSSDSSELENALREIDHLTTAIHEQLKRAYNVQKMAQLRRDLIGVDFLLNLNTRVSHKF